jgi:hypothetical protein
MDRQIVYPGAIPLETDLLNTNKNTMIALSKLAAAIMGTSTMLNGLAVTPTGPASLQVYVAPGEIYSLQNIDGTAYSSLAADTTHTILKQGMMLDQATLSCPAPVTSGYSINYLIQVAYQDTDSGAVVLPYYNSSNPSQAYAGPANSGTAQNTVRKGALVVSAKAGVAATTGTQTTPAADSGYTGVAVVTVAYGQTQITAGNINAVSGAPFINSTLLGLSPAFSVSPTVPTPAIFDNSQKAINSAFLKATGEAFGGLKSVVGATTLDTTYAGQLTIFGGTTYAVNLPAASTYPAGTTLTFYSTASGTVTITRAGADVISVNNALAVNTLPMGSGDTLTLVSNGTNVWEAVSGSAQIGYSANFLSNKAGAGYQKLPGGLIVQWGTAGAVATGGSLAVSYPIAFPTAALMTLCGNSFSGGSTANTSSLGVQYVNKSGFNVYALGTLGQPNSPWISIGY